MTRPVPMERAIQSWTRRHSGTWLHTDEAELQTWLAEAEEHREAYGKVARAWDAAGQLRRAHETPLRPDERRPRSIATKVALAACIVLSAIAGALPLGNIALRWWNGADVHLVTLKGQSKPFVLDDGTRVVLDADSELIAQMGFNRRRITLIRGEALFSVLHDASRPFEITAGSGRVQDLGTRFDMEALADSTRIRVLEGRVAVLTAHGHILLTAGQAGGYDRVGDLDPVRPFDQTATPWLEGQRHFDHERLGDVLERLARYHEVTFLFEDAELRNLRVSGTFKTADLDLFLRTLAAALPIEPRYLTQHQIEITSQAPRPRHSDGATSEPH